MGRESFDFCLKRDFVASEEVYFAMTLESIICNVKFEKFQRNFDTERKNNEGKEEKISVLSRYVLVQVPSKWWENPGLGTSTAKTCNEVEC